MAIVATAEELRGLTGKALEDIIFSAEDMAADWVRWFQKRGERFVTSAARFGYTEATLDLPRPLAVELNKPVLRELLKKVRELVPGCAVSIVEEECDEVTIHRLEISWAAQQKSQPKPPAAAPSEPITTLFSESLAGLEVSFKSSNATTAAEPLPQEPPPPPPSEPEYQPPAPSA